MTLLRGNFSIMLILQAGEETDAAALDQALRSACEPLGLTTTVLPVEDRPSTSVPSHILTVYGADKPGILYRVTETLAARDVNITDVNSRLVGTETPVYALMLEVALPAGVTMEDVQGEMQRLAGDLGVDLSLRPLDQDIL